MKTSDFVPLLDTLKQAASNPLPVLVVTHERPDGDAIGSLTGMYHLLKDNGFQVRFFLSTEVPDSYKSFVPAEDSVSPANAEEINNGYSMVINTDASTVKRLGILPVDFAGIKIPFITFDHHPDNEIFGTYSYVDASASSASEVVYQFARYAGWTIQPDAATSLLLGMTTDTGCFRFSNTTPSVHRVAADLLELGADNARIIDRAYLSKPFNMAMFEAELFRTCIRTALDGHFAWAVIPDELMKKYNINIRNTEYLIEIIRGIDGVFVAAILKPTASPTIFKVSLRSKVPSISVGKVARRLNGGGHEMAAGGTIFAKNAEDAENILLKQVEQEFPK